MTDFLFASDNTDSAPRQADTQDNSWHILIVDDDQSVHDVTRLVLRRKQINGHSLTLHSCLSAAEARESLLEPTNYCLAIVDVIMETDDAGIKLVDWIRADSRFNKLSLVVRSGQPGLHADADNIFHHDLLRYCNKTDVNASRLFQWVQEAVDYTISH